MGPSTPHRCLDARTSPALPNPADIAGVVVTGSHAMVSERAAWSERLGQWLKRCVDAEVPVLGICYGHQLLAHALGGRVGDHPAGLEIGTHAVELTPAARQDPLFAALPESFPAQFVHRQSALELPPGANAVLWVSFVPLVLAVVALALAARRQMPDAAGTPSTNG